MNVQYIQHYLHSSVAVFDNGQCMEVRRGSLRNFAIPNPMIWNSVQEWIAYIPYIQSDLAMRPMPVHFNAEQIWMAQWHETSSLVFQEEVEGGCWSLVPQQAQILLLDGVTGQLVPFYMNLETGIMSTGGLQFTQFSQTPLQIQQAWRFESGVYYRIH
jgi:hypothetical protein